MNLMSRRIEPLATNEDAPERHGSAPLGRVALCVGLVTTVFDLCVYRGSGPAGWSVFFLSAAGLFLVAECGRGGHRSVWLLFGMQLALALRLLWLGSIWQVLSGLLLLPALAMASKGLVPTVFGYCFYQLQTSLAGAVGLCRMASAVVRVKSFPSPMAWVAVLLPLGVSGAFAFLFVHANPDLLETIQRWIELQSERLWYWLGDWRIDGVEIVLLLLVAYITTGWLLPLADPLIRTLSRSRTGDDPRPPTAATDLMNPCRNTLWSVIVLFTAYLVYEFLTLWFREFPVGFYYAGYAHAGAAWLTAALALATFVLSAIFHGPILNDPRLNQLKRLAWVWSALNLLLAMTVYNRLSIYVRFNGMTAMRIVGLFGTSTVVAGFGLVVWKIARRHSFRWLIQRQLWTLAAAVFLLSVTPVDWIVHQYNSRRILAGELAPAVQITEHHVDLSGWLVLHRLVHCEDEIIREGIRAHLAGLYYEGLTDHRSWWQVPDDEGWTSWQLVREQLRTVLAEDAELWSAYEDESVRQQAWQRYRDYAWQWY